MSKPLPVTASVGWLDNPSGYLECYEKLRSVMSELEKKHLLKESIEALASVLQSSLHRGDRQLGMPYAGCLDWIMRGVSIAIHDSNLDRGRSDYIINNLRQGTDCLEKRLKRKDE